MVCSYSEGGKSQLTHRTGSTLIDKFEQFEMTTDLKNTTPREARLGRWVLLYGVLQVLSTLSVDVPGLKHTDGVRYFLCTDLKRCPEWVTNGQLEHLEASQQRSWCWQRSWDPAPAQTAPVELEATPTFDQPAMPPNGELRAYDNARPERQTHTELASPPTLDLNTNLDGPTLMQNDIRRINEKINNLALSPPARHAITQEYERRRENEKAIHSDLGVWKPRFDSLPQPPHPTPAPQPYPPARNPRRNFSPPTSDFDFVQPQPRLRSPVRETMNTDLGGYPFSPEELQWPVPPGYSESEDRRYERESGIGYLVSGGGGQERDRNREVWRSTEGGRERERRSPRRMHERGGW
jgi:hypothetical protein